MKQISLMKKSEEELTKFLLEDTENYTKLSNSLSGRIFEMEEKIVAQDKIEIARLEKELENSGIVLSKELEEIENLKPSGSAFARLGLGSRKKKLLAEAEKRFEDKQTILQNRLKNARKVYEKDRILLQELINKLDTKGIVWHELKRILSEKIAQGFFVHEKLTRQKQKKEEDNLYISKAQKTTKLRGETKDGEGGRTFKEKNVIGRYDFYKIKGLTAAEKKEYEEIFGHFIYDDKLCENPEYARRIRLALASASKNKYKNLVLYSSDKALYNDVFLYFIKEGGRQYKEDFDRIFNTRAASSQKTQFFLDKAYSMLNDSGFSAEFIKSHTGVYARELEKLMATPSEMKFVLSQLQHKDMSTETGKQAFENEVRREIERRMELKHKLYGLDCIGSSPSSSKGYERRM